MNTVAFLCLATGVVTVEASGYEKIPLKHCQDNAYGDYNTLKDAKDACNNDITCNFVYDPQCDGVSPFKMCPNEITPLDSATSCVYKFYERKDCDGSTGCEDYGFCNFDEGSSGECISCENFPNPENDCDMNGFNSQGLSQCKTICPTVPTCTDSTTCGDSGFCNFKFGDSGTCEDCQYFTDPETDCVNAGFRFVNGEADCKSFCKQRCSEAVVCPGTMVCRKERSNGPNVCIDDDLAWCCDTLKTNEGFVPYLSWGKFGDPTSQTTWKAKNCNTLVGGSLMDNCPALPTCEDGIQNSQEEGTDCGGPDCPACVSRIYKESKGINCPIEWIIPDVNKCVLAASDLGMQYGGTVNNGHPVNIRPAGCYWSSLSAFFNYNLDPSTATPEGNRGGICNKG